MTSSNLSFKRAQPCMGTTLEIQLALDSAPQESPLNQPCNQLISEAFARAHSLARALSFFDPVSLLSRYNQGELSFDPRSLSAHAADHLDQRFTGSPSVDELKSFSEVLGKAKILTERFPHGFILDATSVGKIDLGGIAKGAVVDHAYDWLLAELGRRLEMSLAAPGQLAFHTDDYTDDQSAGHSDGPSVVGSLAQLSVNAGGDLRMSGAGAVEVRVPNFNGIEKRYNLQLLGAAVATSSHQGLHMAVGSTSASYASEFQNRSRAATVSVIADTCVWADGFAKIAFQYDLAKCISPAEANEFGLQAVLNFDREGDLISAHEWNV